MNDPTDVLPADEVAELRRLHKEATTEPVPWKANNSAMILQRRLNRALPALLDEVESLRATVARLRTAAGDLLDARDRKRQVLRSTEDAHERALAYDALVTKEDAAEAALRTALAEAADR